MKTSSTVDVGQIPPPQGALNKVGANGSCEMPPDNAMGTQGYSVMGNYNGRNLHQTSQ